MRLNNAHYARVALSSLIRKREKGLIEDADYRALVYGLSQLLGYFKHLDDVRLEERLEALERLAASAPSPRQWGKDET